MKRVLHLFVVAGLQVVAFSGNAWIVSGSKNVNSPKPPPPPPVVQTQATCGDKLYYSLGLMQDSGLYACSERVDLVFQDCAIKLTRSLEPGDFQDRGLELAAAACQSATADEDDKVSNIFLQCVGDLSKAYGKTVNGLDSSGKYCAYAKRSEFGSCVVSLGQSGVRNSQAILEVCNSDINKAVKYCVQNQVRTQGLSGDVSLASCREKLDPVKRQQAEQRRQEEERKRREEAAKQEAARKAAEQAKQEAAKKAAEEAKRKADEEKKKQKPQQPVAPAPKSTTPAPAAPAAPVTSAPSTPATQDPSNSGGGVIVDLPNF